MKKLTKAQIIQLHEALLEETGGLSGLRDDGLLESAMNAPFVSFGNETPYPTIEAKAARLGFGLVKNHPFADGNKRIGVLSMLVFLEINGIIINCTDDELIELGLALADGSITEKEVLKWIISHN